MTEEENKRIAGTEKDFRKGYQDAYKRLSYRPTSVRYVDGYERGLTDSILNATKC